MKGIVWGLSFKTASEKLTDIKNNYEQMGILIENEIKSNQIHRIVFINGDTWNAKSIHIGAPGSRANVVYIERGIMKDPALHSMARCCLMERPWSAYRYFGEE